VKLHEAIAQDLAGFGGILRCTRCGIERNVGDISLHLRDGWPLHCGYTMRWITESELRAPSGSTRGTQT
jgi:hypothetical protein